jgi:hypothetical protein
MKLISTLQLSFLHLIKMQRSLEELINTGLGRERPCEGGLQRLHSSRAGRMRSQKGHPVSNETVRYGLKFCGTWTQGGQRLQGPVAIVRVN